MQGATESSDFIERETSFTWAAKQIGSMAKTLLRPGFTGKVLAVLSNAIYLVSRDEEILWITWEPLPMHNRCLQAPFRSNAIRVGQNFFVQGAQASFLRIADALTIDLEPATEWKPVTIRPGDMQSLAAVNRRTHMLLKTIAELGNAKGLGHTIRLISSFMNGSDMPIFEQDLLVARTRDAVLGLAAACFAMDMREVILRGKELVGLGPGLTPSGDDFLGGLLFTAYSLKVAYPEEFDWEDQSITDFINWAHARTHPISHALLKDHALGHGSEPLHDLVASLLTDRDLSHNMEAVRRLLGIGDASGWDMLAGMLTGMLMVDGKLSKSPLIQSFFLRNGCRE